MPKNRQNSIRLRYLCDMGRFVTDIFSELGRRMAALADGGDHHGIIERAVAANPWFTPAEVRRAACNIAADMLSPDALAAWLSRYPALSGPAPMPGDAPVSAPKNVTSPRNILIIMAGNIPFVGMQDLLCVLAAGHRAIVKPSSKDAVLMSWVVEKLLDIAPELPVTLFPDPSGADLHAVPVPDAVIAMGSDDAVQVFREKYAGVPTLLRGNRSSPAVLSGGETGDELAGLADDVLSYSGLGCRNVSLVLVPRGYDFLPLENALSEREPSLNLKYRNNYRQARAILKMNGTPYIDCRSCLLVEERDFPGNVSILNYSFYNSLHEVSDWIAEHAAEIQCVAGNLPHPRAVKFGRTQRPSLSDYPDGYDTMEFLLSLR